MLEVDDEPELLVCLYNDFPVLVLYVRAEAVHAADCLKERMVAHVAVDVENSCGWCVEAREQLIDHNQQLHLGWGVDESVFCLFLVLLGVLHAKVVEGAFRHVILELQLVLLVWVG